MEINIKKYGNLDGITVLSGLNQSLLEKGIEEIYIVILYELNLCHIYT